MRTVFLVVAALGAASILPGGARASHVRAARVEGVDTFRKAEMGGVAVGENGTIHPGPAATEIAPDAGAQVWSVIRGRDGAIYAATGSDGSIYRIAGGEVRRLAQTFEYEVFAEIEGKDGRLYAAGAPNGTIAEVRSDGSTNTLFDTPEKIVWSLVADPQGNLYAGTGDRGLLYKVTPDGKGTILYRAQDSHIVSLAWSKEGKLIAGTDGRGLLLEINPQTGDGKVLYEVQSSEISKILIAPSGEIYFASTGAPPPKEAKPEEKGDHDQTPVMSIGGDSDQGGGGGGATSSSRVFVRQTDGTIRALWQSPDESIHALAFSPDGALLVGTGNSAGLYRVERNGEGTLLWRPDVGQVLSLWADKDAVIAGTGNPGKVFRLGPETDKDAWIRPDPVDAGTSAAWGRAIWDVKPGSGRWEVRTRSGQTQRPDSTWSDWSAMLSDPEGSQIASPSARYIQIEARYVSQGKEEDPAGLSRIWFSYSVANGPPHIGRIRFSSDDPDNASSHDSGGFSQDLGGGVRVQIQRSPFPSPPGQEEILPSWVRDVKAITWTADDPDSDSMSYTLRIRQVGEGSFHPLAKDIPVNGYAIDTNKLPDGLYEVEVTASDSPSNAPGQSLTDRKVGGPFRVDHTPPAIAELRATRTKPLEITVDGTAHDEISPIVRLEISWDGNAWRPVVPDSGFLDARSEPFKVVVPLDREDEGSWVAVRAVDAAGNEGIGRIWLKR